MSATSLHVLVVEDNAGDARLVREVLRDSAAIAIGEAGTLAAGLARLAAGGVDVVLLDLGLPDSQGLDTVRAVIAAAPGTPVIVLTGLVDEAAGLAAVHAGAQDYLRKGPGAEQALPRAIRYAVERSDAQRRLRHVNRLLDAIRSVNQLIIAERDARRLAEEACRRLVRTGAFTSSWIFLTGSDRRVVHAAAAGFADGASPVALWRGGGPIGCLAALDEEGVVDGERLARICAACPLADAHRPLSRMIARLGRGGRPRGVIGAALPEGTGLDDEQRALLGELAGDVAFALDNIDDERRRREAEEQARRAAAEYQSLADSVPALVARFVARLRHVYVNPAAARAGALPREAYAGRTIAESGVSEPAASRWEGRLRQVLESGEPLEVVDQFFTPAGVRWFRTVLVPERGADGAVASVLSLAADVTEARRNEELLAVRLRLLEVAGTSALPDLLRRTLDEVEALTGSVVGFYHFLEADQVTISLQAWSSRTVRDFCTAGGTGAHYPLDRAGVWVDCVRARRPVIHNDYASLPHRKGLPVGHAPVIRELVVPILRDERIVAILGVGNKPIDYTDEDVRVVTYVADVAWEIVQRKRIEAEREALRANLAQADRLASMGMLAAGVAHEINNPLAYILYNLESVADDMPRLAELCHRSREALAKVLEPESVARLLYDAARGGGPELMDDMVERLREALAGTQRIKSIARSLGTFSRVEQAELAPVNLVSCIEHALTMSSNELKYRARVVRDLTPVPLVLGSDGKLAQVFLNLLINAAHAIEEGHVERNEVRVRTWTDGDAVFAEVRDTGKGIAPEHEARVFEPFFSTKGQGAGSGLGLAICRGIVTELGGQISLGSTPGVGTAFLIRLPRMPSEWSRDGAPGVERPSGRVPVRGRILIVDDEAGIRAAVVRMLRLEHDVVTCASGEEARRILAEDRRFDLVYCDLMMPELSGMELHAWLVGRDPELAEQVVFLTGGAFTPGAAEYLARVGNLRVEKPFDLKGFRKMTDELVLAARSKRR